jgi:predicted signal transduction protein with EAL and GGDEF domain
MEYRQIQFQPSSLRSRIGVALGLALALGLAVAFVILTLGVAILLLPVVAVVMGVAWWRWRRIAAAIREEAARRDAAKDERVIEIDYHVVGDPDRHRG